MKNADHRFRILYFGNEQKRVLLDRLDLTPDDSQIHATRNVENAITLSIKEKPHVILVDYDQGDIQPLVFVQQLMEQAEESVVIGLTERSALDMIVQSIKIGVRNVIHTKEEPYRLQQEISKVLEKFKRAQNGEKLHQEQKEDFDFDRIIGECPQMKSLFETVSRVVERKWVTVLLLGETGTGKDTIARTIHYQSHAHHCPFVEINCSTLPENLLESELFGHEKGAFTDAKTQKKGLFELAKNGTLFLNEIGEISASMQLKLLQALETKKIRRLGGIENISVNTRIIAATNRDLQDAIRKGSFRSDLYYRLNVISLTLPPLREREDDITLLARLFLEEYAQEYDSPLKSFSHGAQILMHEYDWPGNVRELKHTIERIVLLNDGVEIKRKALESSIEWEEHLLSSEAADSGLKIDIPPDGISLDEGEKFLIEAILNKEGWNKTRTCQVLNISRPRLDRKIEKYHLIPDWMTCSVVQNN